MTIPMPPSYNNEESVGCGEIIENLSFTPVEDVDINSKVDGQESIQEVLLSLLSEMTWVQLLKTFSNLKFSFGVGKYTSRTGNGQYQFNKVYLNEFEDSDKKLNAMNYITSLLASAIQKFRLKECQEESSVTDTNNPHNLRESNEGSNELPNNKEVTKDSNTSDVHDNNKEDTPTEQKSRGEKPLYFDRMVKGRYRPLSKKVNLEGPSPSKKTKLSYGTKVTEVDRKQLRDALINEWFTISFGRLSNRKSKVPLLVLWPLLYFDSKQVRELEQLRLLFTFIKDQ